MEAAMGAVVSQIEIEKISTSFNEDGSYSFELIWTLNGGLSCSYTGEYTAVLHEGQGGEKRYSFSGDRSCMASVKIPGTDFPEKDSGYSLSICVPKEAGGAESEEEYLILDTFTKFGGTFREGVLELYWDISSENMSNCVCSIDCDNGVSISHYLTPGARYAYFDSIRFQEGKAFSVVIQPVDGGKVYGVPSRSLRFYPAGIFLQAVDRQILEDRTSFQARFQFLCGDERDREFKAALCVVRDNVILAEAEAVKPDTAEVVKSDTAGAVESHAAETVYTISAEIPFSALLPSVLEEACLSAVLYQGEARSEAVAGAACLPLRAPVLTVAEHGEDATEISVTYAGADALGGYEKSDGSVVYSGHFTLGHEKSLSCTVRPLFCRNGEICRGVSSNAVSNFREGYYCVRENGRAYLQYRQASFEEASVRHVFAGELFESALTHTVTVGEGQIQLSRGTSGEGQTQPGCGMTGEGQTQPGRGTAGQTQLGRGTAGEGQIQLSRGTERQTQPGRGTAGEGQAQLGREGAAEEVQYTLTVATDRPLARETLDAFLKELSTNREPGAEGESGTANPVTPEGFFLLSDAVWRMCRCGTGDVCYLSGRYKPEERFCDLIPGSLLRVETASYMPQYNPRMENSAGFVLTNAVEYQAALSDNRRYIEFNAFVGGVARHAGDPARADGTGNVVYASGIVDFVRTEFRRPYFRVLYPASSPASCGSESPYPADNVVLMASASYDEILDNCDKIRENPGWINSLATPLMIFRGRSTVAVEIPVLFNGQVRNVPFGISLFGFFQQLGISKPEEYRLYRRNAEQRYCPVLADSLLPLLEIMLVCGDRIEVPGYV